MRVKRIDKRRIEEPREEVGVKEVQEEAGEELMSGLDKWKGNS